MLSGVMEHFGFGTSLHPVAYYDSAYHQHVCTDLNAAVHEGGIVAFTGMVGSGKTVLLARMQHHLREGGQIQVCESLVFDVQRVTLSTLKLALYLTFRTPRMVIRVFSQGHFERAQHKPTVLCCRHRRGDTLNAVARGAWYGSRSTAHRSIPSPTSAHCEGLCGQERLGRGD